MMSEINNTRKKLFNLLGEDANIEHPTGEYLYSEDKESFELQHYVLHLNKIETVPALCAKPKGKIDIKRPVVIYLHSHGGNFAVGKSEMIVGAQYLQNPSYAQVLTQLGMEVWAIDAWGFEDRSGIAESELYKEFLLEGKTLWGMRLYDINALINYLATRSDIDINRVATIGMSMGGMMSWWITALNPKIKLCVDISGQTDLNILKKYRLLDSHGFYLYVPALLKETSILDIQKLILPRKRLSMIGRRDKLCFYIGAQMLNDSLKSEYIKRGYSDNFQGMILSGGHQETMEMRSYWIKFLQNNL